jgi:hypothetical protein
MAKAARCGIATEPATLIKQGAELGYEARFGAFSSSEGQHPGCTAASLPLQQNRRM